jgi:hypothetical protein
VRFLVRGVVLSVCLAVALPPAAGRAGAADVGGAAPARGAYFGAYVDRRDDETQIEAITRVETEVGRQLAIDHEYYKWDAAFPTSQETWDQERGTIPFMNWMSERLNGSRITWASIASGSQDSTIVARADAIKAFGSPVYLAFHHEPEDDVGPWGTAVDYVAAFKHIRDVFDDQGVTNVVFAWVMMSWTFDPDSGRDPDEYWPGNAYADVIGSDGYNWYPGKPGVPWDSFETVFSPTNDYATSKGRPWMVVEAGVQEDPEKPFRKGMWFVNAIPVIKGWPLCKAFIYFDAIKEYAPDSWQSDSSRASIAGYTRLSNDPYFAPGRPDG